MLPHFIDQGPRDGWPVVLLHGFPFHHEQWAPQIEALATTYRVIALDMRGHGQTPVGPGPVMIEFLVDDVIELLDHLKLTQATVCGLSMGGYVALRLIDRHPERVKGLILCDTKAGADSNEGRVGRAKGIRAIQSDGMAAFAKTMLPKLFGEAAVKVDAPAVQAIRKQIESTSPEGACHALAAMACRLDLTESLASIDTPTWILVGAKDALTPPADAHAMQAKIQGAQLVEVPNAGHVSNLDDPALVTETIRSALASLA